jgi:nucleotide-binding universal stress UspA family protein
MFRNIMIPLDGSDFAETIVPMATDIAGKTGATLHLVVVHRGMDNERAGDMSAGFAREIDERTLALEKSYLAGIAARTRMNGAVVMEQLLEGPLVQMLQRYVKANGIDAVLMTTHGRGGFQRAWLGSVTDALVRSLPVPVLTFHSGEDSGREPSERRIEHVLAATDGSSIGDNAFRASLGLCSLLDAKCTLVRVIAPALPAYPTFVGDTLPFGGATPVDETMFSMGAYEVMARAAGVHLTTRVLVDALPANAILRAAGTACADLIVVGTHGRNPMARWLLGSVADKVIRGADIPVMVCPADTTFAVPAPVQQEVVVEIG